MEFSWTNVDEIWNMPLARHKLTHNSIKFERRNAWENNDIVNFRLSKMYCKKRLDLILDIRYQVDEDRVYRVFGGYPAVD